MAVRHWIVPGVACLVGDVGILGVALELDGRDAVLLVLGAQVIAVSVAVAVLLVAALVGRAGLGIGAGALAVTAAAVAATPVPVEWSDGCNHHGASTYAVTVPYVLLERPQRSRLIFGGSRTLMECFRVPAAMRCPSATVWPVKRFAMDARRLVGLRLEAARRLARAHGCSVRVYTLDGEPFERFLDSRANRINVEVDAGIVSGVAFTG